MKIDKTRSRLVNGPFGRSLERIAERIERILDAIFLDSHGFLRGAVHKDTLRAMTLKDMRDYRMEDMFCAEIDMPERIKKTLMNYEEAGMTNGDYLMAQTERYQLTGARGALTRARRTYKAIDRLCRNAFSRNPLGRGWLPKPYLGIEQVGAMVECSMDQYHKVTRGLDLYYHTLADDTEQTNIAYLVTSFADWWMQRKYTYAYFGRPLDWLSPRTPHGTFYILYLLALAGKMSSNKRYDRACAQIRSGMGRMTRAKQAGPNVVNLCAESIERLKELKPEYRRLWDGHMQTWLKQTMEDSSADPREPDNPFQTAPREACTLAACLPHAESSHDLANVLSRIETILLEHNHKRMFLHVRPDAAELPAIFAFEKEALSGHHLVSWLLAYWKMRKYTSSGLTRPTCSANVSCVK